jgi:hypothetical protein
VRGEKSSWEESTAQVHNVRALGDLPLIVVSRAPKMSGPYPDWFPAAELERQWQTMQSDLVRLSTRGKQVFALGSDHLVPHRASKLVADSIRELVETQREGK